MGLRRGFKTEANRLSIATREDVGLQATDRLDPMALAEHRSIKVIGLAEYGRIAGCEDAVRVLLTTERSSFSAMTLMVGPERYVVHNESHAATRQASNLAHELAHEILGHPAAKAIGDGGCRCFDDDLEDEADWLAGALLVPREGALVLMRRGMPPREVAEHFGVSMQMCNYRLRITGVLRQMERTQTLATRRRR